MSTPERSDRRLMFIAGGLGLLASMISWSTYEYGGEVVGSTMLSQAAAGMDLSLGGLSAGIFIACSVLVLIHRLAGLGLIIGALGSLLDPPAVPEMADASMGAGVFIAFLAGVIGLFLFRQEYRSWMTKAEKKE